MRSIYRNMHCTNMRKKTNIFIKFSNVTEKGGIDV